MSSKEIQEQVNASGNGDSGAASEAALDEEHADADSATLAVLKKYGVEGEAEEFDKCRHDRVYRAKKKAEFIKQLREHFTVSSACKASGVSRMAVYNWRHRDDKFRQSWDSALEHTSDELENSLKIRALDPKNQGGVTSAIFLLKGRRPDLYKDRIQQDINGTLNLPEAISGARERLRKTLES